MAKQKCETDHTGLVTKRRKPISMLCLITVWPALVYPNEDGWTTNLSHTPACLPLCFAWWLIGGKRDSCHKNEFQTWASKYPIATLTLNSSVSVFSDRCLTDFRSNKIIIYHKALVSHETRWISIAKYRLAAQTPTSSPILSFKIHALFSQINTLSDTHAWLLKVQKWLIPFVQYLFNSVTSVSF